MSTVRKTGHAAQLSFVGRFIDKYYLKQSKSVQTGTFIVFVLLFAYGFLNVMNGKYVLKGNVLAEGPTPGPPSYAAYYGVRWGTEDFASNSRGEYYVALGFGDYLRAVLSGGHDIRFLHADSLGIREQVVWTGKATIHRMDGEFADITIPYTPPAPAAAPTAPGARNLVSPASDSIFFPAAWAYEGAGPGLYQLVVQGVRLASGAGKANATIELVVDNQTLDLRDRRMSDLVAGHLPLPASQSINLGSSLYFAVPGNSLPIRGELRLNAPASGFFQFSDYEEEFKLPDQQVVGQALEIRGSRGSSLTVRLVYSQSVKLYREADWAVRKDAMEADFLNQGLLVRWADPPLGALAETNALWTGPMVPFDVVQRLLKVAVSQQIPLKKIQYHYQFQSTQNPTEMQIGSSKACANSNPIPSQALQQAIAALNEEEFQRVIAPFTCSAPAARDRVRRRTR